ncbi:hypothetical protein TD95_003522 [Thielaviopsis punctulata]|uniref:LYR motif-containing protein 5A n=1 Tax=Thielaviopsis punctulata TaxID=72032 RepID=A0A0F4Z8B8_9PEZI|nr:hypothetical protein TD95_003522 [Thielaviopsis punctulata]
MNPELRSQVISIYKELLFLGRSYPLGFPYFRHRLHRAFSAKAHLTREADIQEALAKAHFIKKGFAFVVFLRIETLYYLKKYRTLRHRYDPFQ